MTRNMMIRNALGLVVVAALMAAMTASVAGAHPGKGKAYGLDRQPICHKPAHDETTGNEETTGVEETSGGGEETTGNEETGRTLYLPEPAIKAHLKHGDDLGACGSETTDETSSCEGDPVAGADEIEVDSTETGDPDVVDAGDVLSIGIDGNFELAQSGTVSVTLEDEDGTQGTFEDGVNAEITEEEEGLRIEVTGDRTGEAGEPVVLDTEGLAGVSSEGVSCPDEVTEIPDATGTGDPVLKTSSLNNAPEADSLKKNHEKLEERLSEHPKSVQGEGKGKGKK